MEKNSTSELFKKLEQKQNEDQKRYSNKTLTVLKKHVRHLRDGLNGELGTTKTAISDHLSQIIGLIETLKTDTTELSGETKKTLIDDLDKIEQASEKNRQAALKAIRWGWLKTTLPILLVLGTFLIANWGLMQWQASRLSSMQEQINQASQTLNQLPQGVRFAQDGAGRSYLLYETEPQIFQTQSGEWATELKR